MNKYVFNICLVTPNDTLIKKKSVQKQLILATEMCLKRFNFNLGGGLLNVTRSIVGQTYVKELQKCD